MSSTTASVCGAPICALLPPPRISSRWAFAAASVIASISWPSSLGFNLPCSAMPLEPRQIWEAGLAAVNVHPAEFGAAVKDREHLARIEQQLRIEGALDP